MVAVYKHNNIVPGGPNPFNLMFGNQFKPIPWVKLRVFILQVADPKSFYPKSFQGFQGKWL